MHPIFWALLVLFLFGALLRMDWVYYLAYVIGGVWLYSSWTVRRSLKQLTVTRDLLVHAFPGQTIDVRIAVENRSRVPVPWLTIEERTPLDLRDLSEYRLATSVGSRKRVEHVYTLLAKRRGYFALGPLSLRSGDLFGFAQVHWQEASSRYITVYPQVLPLPTLGLPSRLPFGSRGVSGHLQEDPARLSGLRAYTTGDSLRRIHWKASAHADTLLVKQLQPSIALDLLVVLNFRRDDYGIRFVASVSEWAATVAASVASAAIAQRQPVGLLCNGLDAARTQTPQPAPPPTQNVAPTNGSEPVRSAEPVRAADPVAVEVVPSAPAPLWKGQPPRLAPRSGQGQLVALLSTLARLELDPDAPLLAERLTTPLASLQWGATVVVVTPLIDEPLIGVLHQACRRGASVVLIQCAQQANSAVLAARARHLGIDYYQVLWDKELQAL